MRKLAVLGAALALVAHTTSVPAQDLEQMCSEFSPPELGQWSLYEATGEGETARIRFAVVPKWDAADVRLLELKITGDETLILQVNMPTETQAERVVVMKGGDQPAMLMPPHLVAMMRSQMKFTRPDEIMAECMTAEFLSRETIEVPAGTFETYRIRPVGGEKDQMAWISTRIPFGIVKAEGGGGSMILQGFGDGAESSITEVPQPMPGMPGMGSP